MMPDLTPPGPPVPPRRRSRRRADSGQSVVEAAIIIPAMIFLVMGILQLTMVQHARIMTEYAAFCAARAGIVYNADPAAMQRAAEVALMPTMARTDTLARFSVNGPLAIQKETAQRAIFGTPPLPVVAVDILKPLPSDFNGTNSAHLNNVELDFDDIRDTVAQANILQIQVRYYYKMSIPFVNQMLQTIFFAQRGNAWALWSRSGLTQHNPLLAGGSEATGSRAMYASTQRGQEPQAANLVAAAYRHFYYFPLRSTYSMRMQSNAYLTNVRPPPTNGTGTTP